MSRFIFACGWPVVPASSVKKTILHCIFFFLLLCQKSVDYIYVGLFLVSVFCSIDLFVCSFIKITVLITAA